jgi:competence protein ComEA
LFGKFLEALGKVPYFSRTQQGVILLLGAALFLLWAWRANFGLAPTPPPPATLNPVFVEVAGAAPHPGVYSFPRPPTLPEVWTKAEVPGPPPDDQKEFASGSRVEFSPEGRCQIGRMSGSQLMTLGLAINLNQAGKDDLEALPGIGPVLAGRIVAYREAHGPFKKIEDLELVSGIGPKKLEQVKPYLILESQEAEAPAPQED